MLKALCQETHKILRFPNIFFRVYHIPMCMPSSIVLSLCSLLFSSPINFACYPKDLSGEKTQVCIFPGTFFQFSWWFANHAAHWNQWGSFRITLMLETYPQTIHSIQRRIPDVYMWKVPWCFLSAARLNHDAWSLNKWVGFVVFHGHNIVQLSDKE